MALLNVDHFIGKLLAARNEKTSKKVNLPESDIKMLCYKAREIFLSQPNLLELETPIKVAGDVHGQFKDLIKIFECGGFPPTFNYLFLGDYVDRGKQSVETISLLFAYKIKYPFNFFLLRGNHECSDICKLYGFYDECKRKYNTKLFKTFTDVFDCLPLAAVVDDKIFCCHGGLSPHLKHLRQINQIERPISEPFSELVIDILWSDPCKDTVGWAASDRGISYLFGIDVLEKFLKTYDFDLMCRGHQVVEDGYEFFGKRKLITIFSAPNYCGEFDNAAALLSIDKELRCTFQIITAKSSSKGTHK